MADIHITATHNTGSGGIGGPSIPSRLVAHIGKRHWAGGRTTDILILQLGSDVVEIWPADPERVAELALQLTAVAKQLAEKQTD